jgi:prevent-host-death family protein
MSEQLTPISKARAKLTRLSRSAQRRMERFIITHEGQPQSVLLGYEEYQSMKAAMEMLRHPEIVEDIRAGLEELAEGKRVSPEEMKKQVQEKRAQRVSAELARELAGESGVDAKVVENVMETFAHKMRSDVEAHKRVNIPGVGWFVIGDVKFDVKGKSRSKKAGSRTLREEPTDIMMERLPETEKES